MKEKIIKILKSHSYHHTEGVGLKSQFKYLAEIAFECCADEIMLVLDQSQFTADEAEEFINQEVEKRIAERMPSEILRGFFHELIQAGRDMNDRDRLGLPYLTDDMYFMDFEYRFRSRLTNDSQKTEGGTK